MVTGPKDSPFSVKLDWGGQTRDERGDRSRRPSKDTSSPTGATRVVRSRRPASSSLASTAIVAQSSSTGPGAESAGAHAFNAGNPGEALAVVTDRLETVSNEWVAMHNILFERLAEQGDQMARLVDEAMEVFDSHAATQRRALDEVRTAVMALHADQARLATSIAQLAERLPEAASNGAATPASAAPASGAPAVASAAVARRRRWGRRSS